MTRNRFTWSWVLMLLTAFSVMWSSIALADECTKPEVRKYGLDGKTISWIAGHCDMDEQDVSDIIAEVEAVNWPKGAVLGQCGCYGPAFPGQTVPHKQCESGYAGPQMCQGYCPGGGSPWVGVCR